MIIFVDEEHRGGRFFFKAVKEGDQVLFATEEELERQIWVNKLYTATGQSHKPVAPNLSAVSVQPHVSNTLTRLQGGWSHDHCFCRNISYLLFFQNTGLSLSFQFSGCKKKIQQVGGESNQLGISFGSTFLQFSYESSRGRSLKIVHRF